MDIDAAFPSQFLKASDLQGKNVTLMIDRVELEEIKGRRGNENKPVVYFSRTKKGLVLNVTNKNAIKAAYGGDTDNWIGQQVILYPRIVDFQGEEVEAIRIRIPQTASQAAKPAPVQASIKEPVYDERNPPPTEDIDDEIPL